ncbi:hypothetical protein [Verrucomicrobium sp. BvORR106]|uniref:hypothetical protein n=1 Tax=Verrucomicrobium sp. BvORR106 TaxID=1403819 RepID=UPI00056E17BF|nr:hypothetical protein [Verrucomicrobium sp. BvORR106]
MNPLPILLLLICGFWLGWGVQKSFHGNLGALDVATVVQSPDAFQGLQVNVSGTLECGLERTHLSPENPALDNDRHLQLIHIPLEGGVPGYLARVHFAGGAIVRGTLVHRPEKGLGTFGLYRFELATPQVLRWPLPVEITFFVLLHVIPASTAAWLICRLKQARRA